MMATPPPLPQQSLNDVLAQAYDFESLSVPRQEEAKKIKILSMKMQEQVQKEQDKKEKESQRIRRLANRPPTKSERKAHENAESSQLAEKEGPERRRLLSVIRRYLDTFSGLTPLVKPDERTTSVKILKEIIADLKHQRASTQTYKIAKEMYQEAAAKAEELAHERWPIPMYGHCVKNAMNEQNPEFQDLRDDIRELSILYDWMFSFGPEARFLRANAKMIYHCHKYGTDPQYRKAADILMKEPPKKTNESS